MKAVAATDVGRLREVNQDYVFCSDKPIGNLSNLFIVADGMGGHKAGDLASRFTVDSFVDTIKGLTSTNPITLIEEAIRSANEQLIKKSKESDEYTGMGTTLVVATIDGDMLYIANVGDSRLYIYNADLNQITQITRDHSLVEAMISMGEIDRKDARKHEKKNIITRAIGGMDNILADFFDVKLNSNDLILMCTDGLTNMLEDEEIKKILKTGNDIRECADMLIEKANNNGGKDNIGVVLIKP